MSLGIGVSAVAASNFTEVLPTPAVTTQLANSTFIIFAPTSGALLAPTDNKGNVYAALPDFTFLFNASTVAGNIWICPNGIGGAGHTFTGNYSAFSSVVLIAVEITSGGPYAVLDQSAASSNLANRTTANAPSVTPTVNNEVILSFLGGNVGSNVTITDTTGYNNLLQSNGNGASNGNIIGGVGGFVQGTAGATQDVFGISLTSNVGTATLSFMPHTGGAPPVAPRGPMPRRVFILP